MEATEVLKYHYLTTRDTSPSRAVLEVFKFSPSDGCPTTATRLASTQALRSRCVSSTSKISDCVVAHRLDQSDRYPPVRPTGQTHQSDPPVRPVWHCCSTVFGSSVLALWINQGIQWFSGEPLETPRTRCCLRQSPLMTRLPRSPGSTFVLRLYQETVHDFIMLFMLPCGPHLTPLATGSLERSLLIFFTPGGLTGDDLSRLFFTYTNTSQAATCTYNS
jgi:hypothetical protein